MSKLRKRNELTINVKTGTREEFFARGRHIAKMLDAGKIPPASKTIIFEDAEDLVKFLNVMKLALLAALRKTPDSISGLAKRLHRSRASVDKDVRLLESVGIVESEYVINPGHGRYRIVKANARPIKLCVETII